MRYKHIN